MKAIIKYLSLPFFGGLIISLFISLYVQIMLPMGMHTMKQDSALPMPGKTRALRSPFYSNVLINVFTH